MPSPTTLVDAWLDLVLGGRCSGCGLPGRALCRLCEVSLPTAACPAWPRPSPPGLAPPWSAAEYAGTVRRLVVDHKEHGRLALVRPLGRLLATAVVSAAGTPALGSSGTVVLVPAPSRAAAVRARRHDPVLRMTRAAATRVRSAHPGRVQVLPLVRFARAVRDQSGLDVSARRENLDHAMAVRLSAAARLRRAVARQEGPVRIVLTDDVITTGATLLEAQRALLAAGLPVEGLATVAATRRRTGPRLPMSDAGG